MPVSPSTSMGSAPGRYALTALQTRVESRRRSEAMKIGLMVGRENTFPQPFIDRVNEKGGGEVTAEFCKLGGSPHEMRSDYRLIVDRISHEIPYYREYLKV